MFIVFRSITIWTLWMENFKSLLNSLLNGLHQTHRCSLRRFILLSWILCCVLILWSACYLWHSLTIDNATLLCYSFFKSASRVETFNLFKKSIWIIKYILLPPPETGGELKIDGGSPIDGPRGGGGGRLKVGGRGGGGGNPITEGRGGGGGNPMGGGGGIRLTDGGRGGGRDW